MSNEFYIGYLPKMPNSVKSVIKVFVSGVLLAGIAFSVLFALGQNPFPGSVFEFGDVKKFSGTIQAKPVPFLLVEREGSSNGLPLFFRYPLVGEGKHGVGDEIVALDGKRVKLKGTLVYRDGLRLIEVVSSSVTSVGEGAQDSEVESLGMMTLRGEIIDSKCYLGVMNPGNKKAHRDCAVACLRGGIPALFLVKDEKGNKSELWLLSDTGEAINDEILDFVAEPVEFEGRVTRQGDQLFYFVKPTTIRRL